MTKSAVSNMTITDWSKNVRDWIYSQLLSPARWSLWKGITYGVLCTKSHFKKVLGESLWKKITKPWTSAAC